MRFKIKPILIMGLVLMLGLGWQVNKTYAIYSQKISQKTDIIREHIRNSEMKNGKGTILEMTNEILAYAKKKRDEGRETGTPGDAKVAQKLVFDTTLNFVTQNPFDSLFMVFNYNAIQDEFISSCLRDDIWTLETLRDKVGAEMIKAYILWDTANGNILKNDYQYLVAQIDLLRKYGSDPYAKISFTDGTGVSKTITSNKYFFDTEPAEKDAINYYVMIFPRVSDQMGCPENEFERAFEEVKNSWDVLSVLGSGKGVEWGGIWEMAEANARIRAREWIRANQISVTLGGESGGRTQSLVKGGGWDKFVGNVKTEMKILKNIVIGPVTPLFDKNIYKGFASGCVFYDHQAGVFRSCDKVQEAEYEKCQEAERTGKKVADIRCDRFRNTEEFTSVLNKTNKQIALQEKNTEILEEAESAFIYGISMDSVAEQNIYEIDQIMWDMNMHIKRGYENVDKQAGKSILTLTNEISELAARQCKNQQ